MRRTGLYLDEGLAQKAVDEFELMLEARKRLAEWLRKAALLGRTHVVSYRRFAAIPAIVTNAAITSTM